MTQPATLDSTEVHRIHSDILDFDYEITIRKPAVVIDSPLPVVIAPDANALNAGIYCIYNHLMFHGEVPPVLNVNIGYPSDTNLAYMISRRNFELTPTDNPEQTASINALVDQVNASLGSDSKIPLATTGGANLFGRFITEELWPWVKQSFDVQDHPTFLGNSQAGMFGLHMLFKQPGFFRRYIIGSPWMTWDPDHFFNIEEEYAASNNDLPVTLFMSAGDSEDTITPVMDEGMAKMFREANVDGYMQDLAEKLRQRNYPNLKLITRILPDTTHNMSGITSMVYGSKAVFQSD